MLVNVYFVIWSVMISMKTSFYHFYSWMAKKKMGQGSFQNTWQAFFGISISPQYNINFQTRVTVFFSHVRDQMKWKNLWKKRCVMVDKLRSSSPVHLSNSHILQPSRYTPTRLASNSRELGLHQQWRVITRPASLHPPHHYHRRHHHLLEATHSRAVLTKQPRGL